MPERLSDQQTTEYLIRLRELKESVTVNFDKMAVKTELKAIMAARIIDNWEPGHPTRTKILDDMAFIAQKMRKAFEYDHQHRRRPDPPEVCPQCGRSD